MGDAFILAAEWLFWPVKKSADILLKLGWKLFHATTFVMVMVMWALFFATEIGLIFRYLTDESMGPIRKGLYVLAGISLILYLTFALQLFINNRVAMANVQDVEDKVSLARAVAKLLYGLTYIMCWSGFITAIVVRHNIERPASVTYLMIAYGMLITDSDNQKGIPIPDKLMALAKSLKLNPNPARVSL